MWPELSINDFVYRVEEWICNKTCDICGGNIPANRPRFMGTEYGQHISVHIKCVHFLSAPIREVHR